MSDPKSQSLRAWQAETAPPWTEVIAAYVLAGRALVALHRDGKVHGGVSPDTVAMTDDGRVVLDAPPAPPQTPPLASITPEQLRGEPLDARSDQFALCASLWEALSGASAYPGGTAADVADSMRRPPEPPARGKVPRGVYEVLVRGLNDDPELRWPGVSALLAALARGPQRTPKGPKIAVAVIVVTLISGALFMTLFSSLK